MPRISEISGRLNQAIPQVSFWGAALWVGWVLIMYSSEPIGAQDIGSLGITAYFISTLALIVSCIFVGLNAKRMYTFLLNPFFMLGCGGLACVGSLLLIGSSFGVVPYVAGAVIGSVLTGIGTSAFPMRTALLFSKIPPRDALIMAAFVQILGNLVYLFGRSVNDDVAAASLVLLPLFASVLFLFDDHNQQVEQVSTQQLPKGFMVFCLCSFLLATVFSVSRGYYPSMATSEQFSVAQGYTEVVTLGAHTLIIIAALFVRYEKQVSTVQYWIIMGLVLLAIISPILSAPEEIVSIEFGCANAVLHVAVWSLLASISYKSGSSALRVFGLGYGVTALGTVVGLGCGFFISGGSEFTSWVAQIAQIVVLFLVVALFLAQGSLGSIFSPAVSEEGEGDARKVSPNLEEEQAAEEAPSAPGEAVPRWRNKIHSIIYDRGLSNREGDVLFLLAKGKNAETIADELCVSYNTARTHIRNVYAKLDVHSRAELLDLVDNYEVAD